MNKRSILMVSRTNWKKLNAMQDKDIDFSEIPGITGSQMARAKLGVGGKPVSRGSIRIKFIFDNDRTD